MPERLSIPMITPMNDLQSVILYLFTGMLAFLAAAINSIAGGGTFLTFPTLVGVMGLTERVANMTSTIGLWPGSASAIYAARKDIRSLPLRLVVLYGILSLSGGTLGALLLQRYTTNEGFNRVLPWLLLTATLLFAFSKPIARFSRGEHGSRSHRWAIIVGVAQFIVAVYGGYFGAGIGILMLASLSFAGLENIHHMNGLKVLLATLINLVASTVFLIGSLNGDGDLPVVDWGIGASMACGSTLGGFWGMAIARKVSQEKLRRVILIVGAFLTCLYFYKAY